MENHAAPGFRDAAAELVRTLADEDVEYLFINVDCVKATMPSWTYPIDLALTADTSVALPLLEEELRVLATPERAARWRARLPEVTRRLEATRLQWAALAYREVPDAMLHALDKALPPEAVVLQETVTNRGAVIRQLTREPGFLYGTGACAVVDVRLPTS